eukprot:TRINITY_DN6734_c0_g1_i4.p3 TRINITY_DN6734_c0_g1~~TRINITY_DN6734_c0_g1_i4.p3  ORF type:complete len:165 (+),score=12.67 TRINITY_DN6734_c0_g1_i4:504-998(+)
MPRSDSDALFLVFRGKTEFMDLRREIAIALGQKMHHQVRGAVVDDPVYNTWVVQFFCSDRQRIDGPSVCLYVLVKCQREDLLTKHTDIGATTADLPFSREICCCLFFRSDSGRSKSSPVGVEEGGCRTRMSCFRRRCLWVISITDGWPSLSTQERWLSREVSRV